MNKTIIILVVAALVGCVEDKKLNPDLYSEHWRPQFHFTPEKNWINDPNGLVFYEGEYHLFYQYNPYGDTWGHMTWGHAVSKDLLHWEHLPLAIEEYMDPISNDSTMIFSGTAVVDKGNTSGLCEGNDCMIAIYTSNLHKDNQGLRQHQSLAYSNDKGRTWKRFDKNPVLDIERKDFRDPKVFWYEPEKKWVMALVVPDLFKVQLYQSQNLTEWKLMSEFGGQGDTLRIWECPDLYQLPVDNEDGKMKWVLSLSGSHPAGPTFVGMQYFVGEFDGTTFKADDKTVRYLDYGKDFYAGIVYNNMTDRTVMIGWLNNWTYANKVPTTPWRGAMAIPRKLTLKKFDTEYQLMQAPIAELTAQRGNEIANLEEYSGGSFEIEVESEPNAGELVELFSFESQQVTVGIENGFVYIDRTRSGIVDFDKNFPSIDRAPILSKGNVKLRIVVDQSSVEVFVNDGESTITSLIFPKRRNKIRLIHRNKITSLKAWEIKSVWGKE